MNQMRWLLRAKRWAQNPPSEKRVRFVFGVIAICLALFAFERLIGLPDWMQHERGMKPKVKHVTPPVE